MKNKVERGLIKSVKSAIQKNQKYIWYCSETDAIFELNLEASENLFYMMIRHEFGFNRTMLFLGRL